MYSDEKKTGDLFESEAFSLETIGQLSPSDETAAGLLFDHIDNLTEGLSGDAYAVAAQEAGQHTLFMVYVDALEHARRSGTTVDYTLDTVRALHGEEFDSFVNGIEPAFAIKGVAARKAAGLPDSVLAYQYDKSLPRVDYRVRYTEKARDSLIALLELDWIHINPLVMGYLLEYTLTVKERRQRGVHYTSFTNIVRTLESTTPMGGIANMIRKERKNPGSFSRQQIQRALTNLNNLRFVDMACGAGNFLSVAYHYASMLEADIRRLGYARDYALSIPLSRFGGCDILPRAGQYTCIQLRLAKIQVAMRQHVDIGDADDIPSVFTGNTLDPDVNLGQFIKDDHDDAVVCFIGNPPYCGKNRMNEEQKADMDSVFQDGGYRYKTFDYCTAFVKKAADYGKTRTRASGYIKTTYIGFVTTAALLSGDHGQNLFSPLKDADGFTLISAFNPFSWDSEAKVCAAVNVTIIGLKSAIEPEDKKIHVLDKDGVDTVHVVSTITPSANLLDGFSVEKRTTPRPGSTPLRLGVKVLKEDPRRITMEQYKDAVMKDPRIASYFAPLVVGEDVFSAPSSAVLVNEDTSADAPPLVRLISSAVPCFLKFRPVSRKTLPRSSAKNYILAVPFRTGGAHRRIAARWMPSDTVMELHTISAADAPKWMLTVLNSRTMLVWLFMTITSSRIPCFAPTYVWNTLPLPKLSKEQEATLNKLADRIDAGQKAAGVNDLRDLYDDTTKFPEFHDLMLEVDTAVNAIMFGRQPRNDEDLKGMLQKAYRAIHPATNP